MPNDIKQSNDNSQGNNSFNQSATDTSNQQNTPPIIATEEVVPPIPQVGLNSSPTNEVNSSTEALSAKKEDNTLSGSAAPSEDIKTSPVVTGTTPKKKFGNGKVIATILGLLVLIGGTSAGIYLTGQNQNPEEKAAQGTDVKFTCTTADAGQVCGTNPDDTSRMKKSWDGQTCVLNVCVNGDTNGDGSCSANDNGAVVTHGNCFTEIQPQVASFTDSTCYQYDTVVSSTDGHWCNLHPSIGSSCSGYESNISTCGGCDLRYFCNLDKTTGRTESKYDPSSNMECNKANPTTCEQNLATYHPGQTTGKCYKTEAEAKADPVCAGTTATTPPNNCAKMWFCLNNGTVEDTEATYNPDNNLECNKVSPPSCEQNLAEFLGGQTTGKCYKTEAEAKADPVCKGGVATTPPTTPPNVDLQCKNIRVYNESWAELTGVALSSLKAGNKVNLCATGLVTNNAQNFDKAKFTINGVVMPETTTKKPGSTNEICQNYTIPSDGTSAFNVSARIHHPTYGWQ